MKKLLRRKRPGKADRIVDITTHIDRPTLVQDAPPPAVALPLRSSVEPAKLGRGTPTGISLIASNECGQDAITPADAGRSDGPSSEARSNNDGASTSQKATLTGAENDIPSKKDYWSLAVDKLRAEEPALGSAITAVQEAAATTGDDIVRQLILAAERSRDALLAKQWKFGLRGKEIIVRDQLEKLVNAVQIFKDLGSAAAGIDPVHAGLPWAGICLIMQLATYDTDQYAAMVAGAEEVSTIISRYNQIEMLYFARDETTLKQEFEARLITLYKYIAKYQVMAACYYQQNTIKRYLRSMPRRDDPSPVLAEIRRNDAACKDIGQVFNSQDANIHHQEIITIFKAHEDKIDFLIKELHKRDDDLTARGGPDSSDPLGNVHWMVTRCVNPRFTGRQEVLTRIKKALRDCPENNELQSQRRFVITGMGGQGKSEICLKLANAVRQSFWGVFWVDVENFPVAESRYIEIAKGMGASVETFEEARQVFANTSKSWLLILDNADDHRFDYQVYFPPGYLGTVLMTSRNRDCEKYATIGSEQLEGLDRVDARHLLLDMAEISENLRLSSHEHADEVAKLLQWHPLALIQAGAYVARGHCNLQQYPQKFKRQCRRLLQFHPEQARSRYAHVHATFEASTHVLEESTDVTAKDALTLLQTLCMFSYTNLPMQLFEAAWQGGRMVVQAYKDENDQNIGTLSTWHVNHLPDFMQADSDEWDSFRFHEACHLLESLALINKVSQEGVAKLSMHPLTYAWSQYRQGNSQRSLAWISVLCVIALSDQDEEMWRVHETELRPHLHACVNVDVVHILSGQHGFTVAQGLVRCGWLMLKMRDDSKLHILIADIFSGLNVDKGTPSSYYLDLFQLSARNLDYMGKAPAAIRLLKYIVTLEEILAEDHPSRLFSQHNLASAYQANGQIDEAVKLLEHVVKVEEILAEDHPSRLFSQHNLASAYQANGQIDEAVKLLEHVVKIREERLAEDHPSRLASQHALASAYQANGQIDEAVKLLEHVVKVEERLAEDHPDRLASQHNLASAYQANGQIDEAVQLLEHVVSLKKQTMREGHPSRLVSEEALTDLRLSQSST